APFRSASLSAHCASRRRTPANANSSADPSDRSKPSSSGWPTPSSTSRRPADRAAAIAKFWAAEAGARVTATAQQVHGGMGIDVTYPVSRYFLWAKQIELALGSAPQQ